MIIKRIKIVLFVCYILFILWTTIFSRHSTDVHKTEFRLMWSYREMFVGEPTWRIDVLQNIANILFFLPFGFLYPATKYHVALISGLILSILIETIQYIACLGLCELDDVLCNGLGTFIGCFLISFINNKFNRDNKDEKINS